MDLCDQRCCPPLRRGLVYHNRAHGTEDFLGGTTANSRTRPAGAPFTALSAYTTVLTVLRTLEAKGYVAHEEEGRQHRYFAKVQQQAAQKSALNHLLGKLFKDSSELLFARLVSDQKLSPEQIRRMRGLLAGKSKKD
jgi:predicted transcriptional regulator